MDASECHRGAPSTEFRILGPLEVDVGRRPVNVGKRERTLLARLLLSPNRVVSADRLIDELWAGDPPDAATRVLRVYVHRLRKALAAAGDGGSVETRPPGYRVRVEAGALDAARFEDLVGRARAMAAAGEHRSAAATMRRALGLWRGPLLADLGDAEFVVVEAARLEAVRLGALEDRIDFDLACGRHHEVLPELHGLTVEHALRERFWAQRMLALYRAGRQAEALQTYQDARHRLVDELGLEPGPALVDLEAAILRQDRILLPRPAVTVDGPASRPAVPLPPELAAGAALPFVSRRAELDEVESLIFDPERRRLAVIWLLGEPGIGKTRLAREIARRAHERDATVLFGWNSEDLAVPYQPVIEALRWYAAHVPEDTLAAGLGGLPGDLVRLAPELGERLGGAGPSRSPSPEVEQYQLFEAVRSWWAAADDQPTVVVLDDLQWAGRPTLALVGHAARHAGPSRAALICTARTTSPDASEALAALAEDLDRRGVPGLRVVLGGLGIDAVGDLVASVAGRPLDGPLAELAVRLRAETAGNPLFIEGLLAGLPGNVPEGGDALPGSLAETVARRVARLPEGVADLLRVAAVAGLDFDLAVVAAGAGRSERDALDALDCGARAGLLEEAGPDRFRFAHALVRAGLRQQLSSSRRVRVHLRVGEAIESLFAGDLDDHAAELAHHFREALPIGSPDRARAYCVMAAERATRLLSHHEAVDAYRLSLDLVGTAPATAGERIELTLRLAQAEFRAGRFAAARETLRNAGDAAVISGTAEQLARIAVAFDEASVHIGFGGTDSLPLLEQAAAGLPPDDTPLRALVLAASARALMFDGRRSESVDRGNEALAVARRIGDMSTTARVLMRTLYSYRGLHHPLELLGQAVELTGLACELGDEELYLFGSFGLDEAAVVLGAVPLWDAILAEQHRLAAIIRQPYLEHDLCLRAQLRALLGGDLGQAEEWLARARRISAGLGWGLDGVYSVVTFLLRREQGRLPGLGPAVRRATEGSDSVWAPGLAALCVETGDLGEARVLFDRLAADGFSGVPRDGTRPVCLGLLAEVCLALGDAGRARWLQCELVTAEGRLLVLTGMAACLGPVDRLLGGLASLAGDRASAGHWFERALTFARNLGSPLWTAYCLSDLAGHRCAEDPAASVALLEEAADLCRRHGLVRAADKVAATRRSFIHST